MGYGDEIMATGMARGAQARGKRIAFGDRARIIYSPWSEPMFRHNPNIARPGDEGAKDLEWIPHYKGSRLYNRLDRSKNRWLWNKDFRPIPGELFFDENELKFAEGVGRGFVIIEPNVPTHKSVAPNKDWGVNKYQDVARDLKREGFRVIQFGHERARIQLDAATMCWTPDFRHSLAVLARAALYIGPEGGLHHGAAAVGIPAVVLFGGFIPPETTGYKTHTNITGGAQACGSLRACPHCRTAMDAIRVGKVLYAAHCYLDKPVAA